MRNFALAVFLPSLKRGARKWISYFCHSPGFLLAFTAGGAAPDIPALVADETENLLASLPDTTAEQIVRLKLQGYTHEEIADELDCNVRTVERRLKQIRELWQRKVDSLE